MNMSHIVSPEKIEGEMTPPRFVEILGDAKKATENKQEDFNGTHIPKNWRYKLGQGFGYAVMSVLVALPIVILGKNRMKKNGR